MRFRRRVMRSRTVALLLAAACGGVQASERPVSSADIAEFVPNNRRILSRLDADISGDGVPDTIVVAASEFEATVTVLLQLQGKAVVGKGPMKGFQGVDSLQLELTPLGPPTVVVRKGVLIIESLTGGNTVRTAATYRYRFDADEGRMRLIGLDAERTSRTFGIKLSWNVLTGARTVRRGKPEGQAFRYGPESRTKSGSETIYMSLTPNAEELLDKAVGAR